MAQITTGTTLDVGGAHSPLTRIVAEHQTHRTNSPHLTDESARTTTKFLPMIVGEHCTGDAIKMRDAVRNMESHSSSCSGRPTSTRLQKKPFPFFLPPLPPTSSYLFHTEPKGSVAIFCQRDPSPYCFFGKKRDHFFSQQVSVDVSLSSTLSDSHSHTTVTTHRRKA